MWASRWYFSVSYSATSANALLSPQIWMRTDLMQLELKAGDHTEATATAQGQAPHPGVTDRSGGDRQTVPLSGRIRPRASALVWASRTSKTVQFVTPSLPCQPRRYDRPGAREEHQSRAEYRLVGTWRSP